MYEMSVELLQCLLIFFCGKVLTVLLLLPPAGPGIEEGLVVN